MSGLLRNRCYWLWGNGVRNPLQGAFAGKVFNPISLFEQFPLSVEDRIKKVPDGAGV